MVASSATTAPRKPQHGYDGFSASASSLEAIPTTISLPIATGLEVTIAAGLESTSVFQIRLPLPRLTANTWAPPDWADEKLSPATSSLPTIAGLSRSTFGFDALAAGSPAYVPI